MTDVSNLTIKECSNVERPNLRVTKVRDKNCIVKASKLNCIEGQM